MKLSEKTLCFIFSLFLIFPVFAQKNEMVKWRYTYEYFFKKFKEREKPRRAEMVLDIGTVMSEFYSPVERKVRVVRDSLAAKGAELAEILTTVDKLGLVRDYQFYTVYKNYPSPEKLVFVDRLLSYFYLYEEPLVFPEWKIESEQKEILNYNCQKATADFLGRKWTVWFTPDIPISHGPWKLGGLPGLILQAEEAEGDYSFMCIGMQKVENGGEIKLPKRNYLKCTREEFLKDINLLLTSVSDYMQQKQGLKTPIKRLMPDGSWQDEKNVHLLILNDRLIEVCSRKMNVFSAFYKISYEHIECFVLSVIG